MISFTNGNLLDSDSEALVNTVNTVGIMGKGIALMFKESFPENYKLYRQACDRKNVRIGKVFVTHNPEFIGPKWIVNFPTKNHWRGRTELEWIRKGLEDLRKVVVELDIRSISIPPLGCGNGGLKWETVRPLIISSLGSMDDVEITIFEPTRQYQNISKRSGVDQLTPARALIAELIRQYWVLGIECSVLEVQKLVWFLSRMIEKSAVDEDPLKLAFKSHRYGPYSDRLRHLLDAMDGSYLHCSKRLSDAGPTDTIWFEDSKKEIVDAYLKSECKQYLPALEACSEVIDGFQSPLGLEALATVDWLLVHEKLSPTVESLRNGVNHWTNPDQSAADRKNRIFDDHFLKVALDRVTSHARSEM
jgi:O-acetyl-ADP-ribose deacetylase (regulator of RNase III)